MKKVLLSILIGSAMTLLLYWLCTIPSNGPRLLVVIVVVPIQAIVNSITKDREMGEILFWSVFVLGFSSLAYIAIQLVAATQKNKH